MSDLSVDQVQDELRRGIEFFQEFNQQVVALLTRLAELLEENDLPAVKRPFAKDARRSAMVQSYLLLLKPTGAELESEDDDENSESEDADAESDQKELEFPKSAKLPYVAVQLMGKPPANARGAANLPFIQYGALTVLDRKDGKPLDETIKMSRGYYSNFFRSRVCNPSKKPPYTHRTRRGGATLNFEEFSPHVLPLARVRSEQDIEALAKEISEYVQGASA
jgi:hypothetical protein